jgi:hypothetical protein
MHQSASFFQTSTPNGTHSPNSSAKSPFLNQQFQTHHSNISAAAAAMKFANLFPNITPNAVAAAVSSLNPFSIESLLAPTVNQRHSNLSSQSKASTTANINSNLASTLAAAAANGASNDLYGI